MTSTRVYIETYGCQMNMADGEVMHGLLARTGFARARSIDDADVILLNTCAIREHAEERVAGRMTQLLATKLARPGLRLGVVGCMAQHQRDKILERLPFVDLVLGPDEYRKLPDLLGREGEEAPQVEVRLGRDETYADVTPVRAEGVRAWITVMRGCDRFCTFCVVPYTRGRERSLPLPAVLGQVRTAAASGFREVTFLGQTVNAYQDGDLDFADLLRAAARVDGIERLRFTSPHPCDMTPRVVEAIGAEDKVQPQIHLPLQSASNAVLAAMERGYTIEDYDRIARALRAAKPGLELSTDVLVGFPGESEADFEATHDYVAGAGFDSAFLFAYSPREGTRAARFAGEVPAEERQRRLQRVIDLQEEIGRARSRAWIGRTVEVLVEGRARRPEGWLSGKSREFRTVVLPPDAGRPGDLVRVRVADATSHTLIAESSAVEEPRCALA